MTPLLAGAPQAVIREFSQQRVRRGRYISAASAYAVSRSLRFNSADSAYLSRTPASAGNRKTWTWSGWVKFANNSSFQNIVSNSNSANNNGFYFALDSTGKLDIHDYVISNYTWRLLTTAVFRDFSAWYHIVFTFDTTQATSSNRARLYVNGSEITVFSVATYPTPNSDGVFNNTQLIAIGNQGALNTNQLNGYLADIHFIDGYAYDPSYFGETNATTGVWDPKTYSGSYGSNGFHLDFADNSAATAAALGKDTSGNGLNWTPNNLSIVTGGPTSVASASGALPLYNTTDTYGATKGTGTRTDSNSSSISLALPMDGSNNGTTFTDESATIKGSGSAKSITRFNAVTSTAQSKYYGSSGSFGSAGTNYISVASSTDFAFGTGDFTVEFHLRVVSSGANNCVIDIRGTVNAANYLLRMTSDSAYDLRFAGTSLATFNASASTWNHIAISRSSGTTRVYVNGLQAASFSDSNNASSSGPIYVSTFADTTGLASSVGFEGYMQDLRIYKGVAKYTSNFNPPSSTQNPTIAAGNDSLVDSPTNGSQTDTGLGGEVVGNYCTWNPLDKASAITLANGNLDASYTAAVSPQNVRGTIAYPSSGKWYYEYVPGGSYLASPGIAASNVPYTNVGSGTFVAYREDGQKNINATVSSYGAAYVAGDVIGVAYNVDANTVTFYKNGVSQGALTPTSGVTYFPFLGLYNTTSVTNFGQRPFAYTAPSGFKALCTANLPTPTIAKGSDYMDVKLYTGNGSTQTISGLNFSPDLVWYKQRNGSYGHDLFDIIRGAGNILNTNNTLAEYNEANRLTAFNSDGFSLGSNAATNGSSSTYVAWAWDAGSSTVSNTSGSITSQVRANASAGFSVITATQPITANLGCTVGHGLNVAPTMYIVKDRDLSINWGVYHAGLSSPATQALQLSTTSAAFTATNYWKSTSPTSTVLSIGTSIVGEGNDFVVYAFAPVAGYSSFGSYTGNGSADGPFVYTGFRPKWILIKVSAGDTGNWWMYDSARSSYNLADSILHANLSLAEFTSNGLDILSNGFKIRTSNVNTNGSGFTFVYAAFAESPFAYARAR